jgi:hypothetical protein
LEWFTQNKDKTLTNKKHSYESDKRLLGLVWIALAATAYYCIDILRKIDLRQTGRFSFE